MADDKQSGPGLGSNSVVLLVAAVASAVYVGWRAPPLVSSRPTGLDYDIYETKVGQDIDARLWEDPFAAVERDRYGIGRPKDAPDAGGKTLDALHRASRVIGEPDPARLTQTLVIGVTLPGAPYPEDAETRRRLRYAVLAALHTENYYPADEQHIGYFLNDADISDQDAVPSDAPNLDVKAGFSGSTAGALARENCREPAAGVSLASPAGQVPMPGMKPPGAANKSRGSDERRLIFASTGCAVPIAGASLPAPTGPSASARLPRPCTASTFGHASGCAVSPECAPTAEVDPRAPRIVPFERFKQTRSRRRITVLWLNEDELKTNRAPILALGCLAKELDPWPSQDLKFAIVGPQDSTTLAKMVGESDRRMVDEAGRHGAPRSPSFPMFNFGATAEDPWLLKRFASTGRSFADLAEELRQLGIRYYRTTKDNGELAKALVSELERRGFDPSATVSGVSADGGSSGIVHRDHVVLISEWDSVYGRQLLDSVSSAFAAADKASGDGSGVPPWIEKFSYMRGLDGRLPDPPSAKMQRSYADGTSGKSDDAPASATAETAYKFESAEGQSQFDYLRRLADHIKRIDAQLRSSGPAHVAAIGILGHDVYDKLMILQALRPEFPETNFFTTDLDALLLPENKSHYTRNLLIASSYGLELNPALQEDIPPFRSSYQSSIFLAARLAIEGAFSKLRGVEKACEMNAALAHGLAQPLLFQIGRTGPQPLPTEAQEPARVSISSSCLKTLDPPTGDLGVFSQIQPAAARLLPVPFSTRLGAFLAPLLLVGTLFCSGRVRQVCFADIGAGEADSGANAPAITGVRKAWSWCRRRIGRIAAGIITLLVLAVWAWLTFGWLGVAQWLTENGTGEPILIFEGISIWPTIALRTFGILLVLFLIWYTVHDLEVSRRETLERFKEPREYEPLRKVWKGLRAKQNLSDALGTVLWFPTSSKNGRQARPEDGPEQKSLTAIASGPSGHPLMRCVRAGIGTALMFVFMAVIVAPVFRDVPFDPARGSRARALFDTVTIIEVLATWFLTFLVVDATLYSREFIKRLTAVRTAWSENIIRKYKNRFEIRVGRDLVDWIDLRFLAERTRSITQLVYLPFLALAVLVLSRGSLFDNFSMPLSLLIAQAANLCVIVGAVLAYRWTAEAARTVACRHLAARIIAAKGSGDNTTADQLDRLLVEMKELSQGAFAPWSGQPIVRAVLLPLVSYGGVLLAHVYALPGT